MISGKALRRILIALLSAAIFAGMLYAHWPISPLPEGARVDFIRVEKAERKLTLYENNAPLASYTIALGRTPIGPKTLAGDNKTPEGIYEIDFHKEDSSFHRALHISYPAAKDMSESNPGGDIMIHGIRNGLGFIGRWHRLIDWTQGCMALTNDEIEQIYAVVPDGTHLEIRP